MEHGPDGNTNGNTGTRNFYGSKPREIAAREIFPILVELANDGPPPITYGAITYGAITYVELADRILEYIPDGSRDQPGPRAKWMGWPLGNIWHRLFDYQQESNMEICTIPYLTTIVVNQDTRLPTIFKTRFHWSNEDIRSEQCKVYNFESWTDVLEDIMQ